MLLTLDTGAVLAFSAMLAAVAALLLLTTWRTTGRPGYLAAWAGFCGLSVIAFLLQALRGVIPDAALIYFATPLYSVAWGLFWVGTRRLRGARVPPWVVGLAPLAWYLACAFPAFRGQIELRGALGALLLGLLTTAGAIEVLRLRGSAGLRRAGLAIGLLNLSFGAILLARAGLFGLGLPVAFSGMVFLFGALLTTAIGFAGLALASIQAAERDTARIATVAKREAAALEAGRADILRLHGALPALVFLRDGAADGASRLLYRGGDVAAVTGWSAAELAGLADLDSLNAPEVPRVVDFMRQTLRDGHWLGDWRMRRPDGTLQWMRTHARRLSRRPDGGGEVVGYILNVDAEHRAAAATAAAMAREAAALEAGRAELERLHAGLPAIVFHRATEPDGTSRLLYRGGDLAAVAGWPADAMQGLPDLDALGGPGSRSIAELLREVLRDGTAFNTWQMLRPDGGLTWMRTVVRRVSQRPDGGGEVVGYVLNIEAEVQAAAEARAALLREAAALEAGRAQVERLHAGLPALLFHRDWFGDGTSRLLYRAGDAEAVTGWPAAALAAEDSLARLTVGGPESYAEFVQRLLQDGAAVQDWQLQQPEGAPRWMRSQARRLSRRPDGGGEMVGTVLDVSAEYAAAAAAEAARAREAEALREGRAQVERLHAGLPAILFHREVAPDGESRLLYRGGDHLAVTGWPEDALPSQGVFERYAAPGTRPFTEHLHDVLRDGTASTDWRMRQPDGTWRWMRNVGRRLTLRPDGGGEVVGYVLDVSAEYAAAAAAEAAREREAAALQAGRAEVERLLTGLPAVIFLRDISADGAYRLLYRGGDIEAVTGWPAAAIAELNSWREFAEPGSPDPQLTYLAALRDGEAKLEWRMRRPDGSWSWIRSHVTRLSLRPDGGGEVAGYMLSIDRERTAEAELETMLRAAPLVVYRGRVSPDGGFTRTYLSRGIERLTGWPWEVVNAPGGLLALMNPEDHPDSREGWLELLRQGLLITDQRLRCADGAWLWARCTLVVVARDATGGAEVVGFIVDVTAEREAEARALEARAELDRTLAAAPLAVLRGRIAPDGHFRRTYLSRGIERLTGWAWEDVSRRGGLAGIVDPASLRDTPPLLRQLLREGMVQSDLRLRRADASWLEVRSTVTVLDRLADGGVEVVGFMAEVTAERAAQAQAAAAGRLAALGEMGTGLAHELKQPLATISLAAENALRGFRRGNPEAVGPRLERIIDQAQRAAGIIENLRRFARGSEPGAPPVPVPLDRAVESALALVGGPLQEAGIEVALALEAPPPLALGQMVSLEQVLVNLLLNAADALRARPAGAPRRIRIAAAAAGEMVRLTIADSGGGIHAAILPRLFEPFVSTKDADQGTGLGLSICHGLVKAMGGSIEARNEAEGAVFSILLPRAVAAASLAG